MKTLSTFEAIKTTSAETRIWTQRPGSPDCTDITAAE